MADKKSESEGQGHEANVPPGVTPGDGTAGQEKGPEVAGASKDAVGPPQPQGNYGEFTNVQRSTTSDDGFEIDIRIRVRKTPGGSTHGEAEGGWTRSCGTCGGCTRGCTQTCAACTGRGCDTFTCNSACGTCNRTGCGDTCNREWTCDTNPECQE